MINLLKNITPEYLIYIFYGAAFLFLGVSIAAKNMKGSELPLAGILWLLSLFGFLHGAHEWLEIGPLIEGEHLSFEQIFTLKTASVLFVVLSFIVLLQFGVSLLRILGRNRWAAAFHASLFLAWFLYVWHFGFHNEGFHIDMQSLRQADIGARYTFGFAGSLMTAYGLIANSREISSLSRPVAGGLRHAGFTFLFYAVFTAFFPSDFSLPFFPVPVVVLRGIAAVFITYFIIKALNIFDIEMRIKYDQQRESILQAEKLTSLGRLAAGIAHEINNPLANASLGVQTLKSKMARSGMDGVVERLDAVERNIDKASVIAAELLQFARQKESAFVPINIGAVIDGALKLLRYRMENITVRRDATFVPAVYGDPGKLERVFINILSNSLDAMPEGGDISIQTAQADGLVVIRVFDTGPGIAKEHLSMVFDPFFTTKDVGGGTGLGLAICYGIIKQHQGTIDIAKTPVRGTVVTIKLPAEGS